MGMVLLYFTFFFDLFEDLQGLGPDFPQRLIILYYIVGPFLLDLDRQLRFDPVIGLLAGKALVLYQAFNTGSHQGFHQDDIIEQRGDLPFHDQSRVHYNDPGFKGTLEFIDVIAYLH